MAEHDSPVSKGLVGVVADYTSVSMVNAQSNSLLYRGYPVGNLADKVSFEAVAWLLWNGELPSEAELDSFRRHERAQRRLEPRLVQILDQLPTTAHPMDVVRTAVSVLGAQSSRQSDNAQEDLHARAMHLFAVLPGIVAYSQRRRNGQQPLPPREDLDYCENFLWMSFGEVPHPVVVNAFRVSMILYAEHSFNASTFTARVISSTLSDFYSAVTGAVGALKGPLHGGANEAVMGALNEIGVGSGAQNRADRWLAKALTEKRKIMGFGHRVYKHGDSRVPTMRVELEKMVTHTGRADLMETFTALEKAMVTAKNIAPNLDYPSGPAYHLMGFDTEVFTPLFVASRITGWAAHIMEQRAHNTLIRPLSAYNGRCERHV